MTSWLQFVAGYKTRKSLAAYLLIALTVFFWPYPVWAWPRMLYSDTQITQRADLIVIAHVKGRSLTRVLRGGSYESRATLVITQILKGVSTAHEVAGIIHYGLLPVPSQYKDNPNGFVEKDLSNAFDVAVTIQLYEDNPDMGCTKISDDILKDQIWFLRTQRTQGQREVYAEVNSTDALGVWDPEDVQPLNSQSIFQALVSADPDKMLKTYAQGQSPLATRAQLDLDQRQIDKILQEPDLEKRADLLLPFCLFTDAAKVGRIQSEAELQLWLGCGKVGVARLVPIFSDPKYRAMQSYIMTAWANVGYRDAVPLLVDLLKAETQPGSNQAAIEERQIEIISTLIALGYRDADSILASWLEKEAGFWAKQHVRELRWYLEESPDPSSLAARGNSHGRIDAIMKALTGTHNSQALKAIDEINLRLEVPPSVTLTPLPISSTQAPSVGPKGNQPWQNSLGMKFVPAGTPGVLFSVWDTRVEDYQAFVAATGREWPKPFFEQGPTHPAVNTSWDDAQLFCQWLTQKERNAGKIGPNQIFRLPTDAEWSIAVGLAENPEGTPGSKGGKIKEIYPWGTVYPPPQNAGNYLRANDGCFVSQDSDITGTDGYPYTSPVGSFKPNRYGLYDLGGNVWQWCEDCLNDEHDYGLRTLRGGSWYVSNPGDRLSSSRGYDLPNSRVYDDGFRCVLANYPFASN